ncbi:hypothetical protein BJX70DRAFT_410380 [Aspergillus crustosus]
MQLRARTLPLIRQLSPLAPRSSVTTTDSEPESLKLQLHPHVYTIYQSLKPNYTIIDDAGFAACHIQTKGFRPASPHLTMYHGKDAGGPVIAFVKISKSPRAAHLVRGHPSHAQNAIWEDLRRIDWWAGVKYRWEMAVIESTGDVARRGFVWKRTRTHHVEPPIDQSRSLLCQRYKLVDEKTRELLAVLSVDYGFRNFRRLAKVRFVSERYGRAFKQMVFLSALVVKDWED